MKRLILTLALLVMVFAAQAQTLVNESHPRLIMDDEAFAQLRANVLKGENEALTLMHDACMKLAETRGLDDAPLEYKKDASDKRILSVSRSALLRIFTDAYAYRFTGDEKFLRHAESDILAVCSFPNWNPSHFLDVGEMATAVGIGYDWLYGKLKPETRAKAVETLRNFAFSAASNSHDAWFYTRGNNWNQVCNGGLVCAALATFEENPAISRNIINSAVKSNSLAMFESYAPDGNYAEGPGYWEYGTSFEVLMLTALESCLGQDYGISNYEGFSKTGDYILYSLGSSRKYFNFSDNGEREGPRGPMWYFASRFNKPYLLRNEIRMLKRGQYADRLMPLYVYYADKIDPSAINGSKLSSVYSGRGRTPVVLAHSSWEDPDKDKFLGFKGGRGENNHGHLDAGSFVYDSDGMRWATDLGSESYANMEVIFSKVYGGGFWNMTQNSPRWQVFKYNNRQHNTLTVNDKNHNVTGQGTLVEVYDSKEAVGGKVDITTVFGGDLKSAVRKAVIRNGDYLEVTDELVAPADAPADVRWTFVTRADVEVTPDGIVLSQEGVRMLLKANLPGVRYQTWSSDPSDYKSAICSAESKNTGVSICGFTFTLPASGSVQLVTTLKRQ